MLEARFDEIQQLSGHLLITMADVLRDEFAIEQVFDRVPAHRLRREPRSMLEAPRGSYGMNAAEEAPDPLAVVLVAELRPLPAPPGVDGKAEAAEDRDRAFAELTANLQFER